MNHAVCESARVNPVRVHPEEQRAPLDGQWRFRLDPDDAGRDMNWYECTDEFHDDIAVPGCWQGQGFGDDSMEEVWDFRLTARTFRATYTGTAWYAKSFTIPSGMTADRLHLNFGGVHPSAEVWLNGKHLGEHHMPFVPFSFDVTDAVRRDSENELVVRVSEQDRYLGLLYNWQGNWSGLYRGVEIRGTGTSWLESVRLYPDAEAGVLRGKMTLGGEITSEFGLRIDIARETDDAKAIRHDRPVTGSEIAFEIAVDDIRRWSPDDPALYCVDIVLTRMGNTSYDSGTTLDAISERTGFMKLGVDGKHFLVNGDPYYMRGTGEFLASPETGSPDTDRPRLRRKLQQLRDYGYNYVRFQSYVPAPEYYDVADEVGLILQSEMGMLGALGGQTQWRRYQWPEPTPEYRGALREQWNAVVRRDVNHPSANIYCMSNELLRNCMYPRTAWRCHDETKMEKPTAFVIWTDGGYNSDLPGDFVNDSASVDSETDLPVIQHEFQWWSSMPDPAIAHKYNGAMRPYAQDLSAEAARQHGTEHALELGASNSKRLQFIESKAKMERCRLDNETLAGICHFNAMDTSLSPQGIIDEFFEKKYADADQWLQTNGDTVLMADIGFDDRILVPGQVFETELSVSDFSHPSLSSPVVEWRLVTADRELASGRLEFQHTAYRTTPVGKVRATVPEDTSTPSKVRLRAEITDGGRTFNNEWDFWIMPVETAPMNGVVRVGDRFHTWLDGAALPTCNVGTDIPDDTKIVVTEVFDERVESYARNGGWVILVASEGIVRPYPPKFGMALGNYYFTPPANYPPYEDGHDGTIVEDHPALAGLLHDGFADFQFFRLITHAPPIELEPLMLNDADPVIRVMHSFPVGRSLAYLTERRLGKGGVIVCALNLDATFPEGSLVFADLCEYAVAGTSSAPEITLEAIEALRSGTTFA
jgi:beta-galactosidase